MLARPVWFHVAIWLEVLVQAPFYALAILAFLRGGSWIRLPALVYSSVLLTIMPIRSCSASSSSARTPPAGRGSCSPSTPRT